MAPRARKRGRAGTSPEPDPHGVPGWVLFRYASVAEAFLAPATVFPAADANQEWRDVEVALSDTDSAANNSTKLRVLKAFTWTTDAVSEQQAADVLAEARALNEQPTRVFTTRTQSVENAVRIWTAPVRDFLTLSGCSFAKDEFRCLGKELAEVLRTQWELPC